MLFMRKYQIPESVANALAAHSSLHRLDGHKHPVKLHYGSTTHIHRVANDKELKALITRLESDYGKGRVAVWPNI